MAAHDAYARWTPYELLFPAPDFANQRFPAVEAEARARGTDLDNPAAFALSGAVQGILADLRPDEPPPAPATPESAPPGRVSPQAVAPEASHAHGDVLFFAYHLWRTTCSGGELGLALVTGDTLRTLLVGAARDEEPQRGVGRDGSHPGSEGRPAVRAAEPGWEPALQGRAGYVQLPQHMVWAEEAGAERPESMDGFFWAATRDRAFHAAAVTGMRQDRPGYGVIPVPPQPLDSLSSWTAEPAREGGAEFSTSLPGAQMDGLAGIRTPAELLKLMALALERWASGAIQPAPSPPSSSLSPAPPPAPLSSPAPSPPSPSSAPAPSGLPYVLL